MRVNWKSVLEIKSESAMINSERETHLQNLNQNRLLTGRGYPT